jgi:hypothetical protein
MRFDVIDLKARRCSVIAMTQTHHRLEVVWAHSAQWKLAQEYFPSFLPFPAVTALARGAAILIGLLSALTYGPPCF